MLSSIGLSNRLVCLKRLVPCLSWIRTPRYYSEKEIEVETTKEKFETVFTLPSVRYIAQIARLKVYHLVATALALPSAGILEAQQVLPSNSFLTVAYVGITGAVLFGIGTLPFSNVIGFLYISEDNSKIKISSINVWGKRVDRVVSTDEWIPLLDLPSKTMDTFFLTPQLKDGTKYKLLVRFGKVLNTHKIGLLE